MFQTRSVQISGNRLKLGFGAERTEKNTNLQKGKEGRTDTSESQSEGAVPQSQTPTEVGFITVRSNKVK